MIMELMRKWVQAITGFLVNGQFYWGFYVMGAMGVLGAFFGRMICGWACPFGFVQELFHKIPSPKFGLARPLKYVEFLMLIFFVILLPLLAVDQFVGGEPWFCKFVCPAGTWEAGIPMILMQPKLRATVGLLFFNKLIILIGFFLAAVFISRSFCRTTCPLGAFYALFAKAKLVKLRLDSTRCTKCGACHRVCPTGVKFNENSDDVECISCMACINVACKTSALYLEVGGVPFGRTPQHHLPVTGKIT